MAGDPATAGPEVVLVDGDDASGLASMLADLMTDNLRDFPGRARVARRARGSVVMRAADHDIDVTLTFTPGRVELRDGAAEGIACVAGPWLEMAKLCSGQVSPISALRHGGLMLTPGRGLATAAAAGYVLSVPVSFYDDGGAAGGSTVPTARRRAVVAGVVAVGTAATAAAALVVIVRRHRPPHHPQLRRTRWSESDHLVHQSRGTRGSRDRAGTAVGDGRRRESQLRNCSPTSSSLRSHNAAAFSSSRR